MHEEVFGDYQVIDRVGRGPLGDTYIAEHRFLKRRFILKVLPQHLAQDDAFLSKFTAQVQRLAQLEHINLAKMHYVSEDTGRYFLVSDCILDAGGHLTNLGQYLSRKEERLTEEQILSILKQIAYPLDYLHDHGVSGGIKLSNIHIGHSQEGPLHLFLTDFGLSSVVGEGYMVGRSLLSLAEQMVSSSEWEGGAGDHFRLNFQNAFYFLAPEQRGIEMVSASANADAYAFGTLAYFLLTGTYPEGLFPMPSKVLTDFTYDWDTLILATLQRDADKRQTRLCDLLNMGEKKELSALKEHIPIAPTVKTTVREVQESFSFGYSEDKSSTATMEKPEVSQFTRVTPQIRESELHSELANLQGRSEKKPILNEPELEKPKYEEDPGAIFQTETVVSTYTPSKVEEKHIEPLLCEMIIIEGGEYQRGSNVGARDEKPMHNIVLNSYALDMHPVTNEQFVRFLDMMGGEKDSNNNDLIHLKDSRIKKLGGKLIIESGYAKHPAVGVSWYGATAYAKWVGKRLPTEAEWEVAASSGTGQSLYPSGEQIERSQANFFSSDTTSVMSYPPNPIGLYDMAGNVYEWCEDWYCYNYYESSLHEPDNPAGPAQGVYRVLRGGCWKSLQEDLRCSHRHRNNPGAVNRTYGFRCAADAT